LSKSNSGNKEFKKATQEEEDEVKKAEKEKTDKK
jgi:hypothetical protein